MSRRPGLAAALLAACGVLLVGCGSTPAPDQAPRAAAGLAPGAAVEQAVARTTAVSSSSFTATITADGTTMTMTGKAADRPEQRVEIVTEVGSTSVQTRVIGSTVYVSLAGLGLPAPAGKRWLRLDTGDATALGALGLGSMTDEAERTDPARLLEMLQAAGEVTAVGQEDVDGRPTTHYRGTLDLATHLDRLPERTRKAVADQLVKAGVSAVDIDAWIDDEGLPARVTQTMDSSAGQVVTDFRFTGFDEPVDVVAPPADQTVDAAQLVGR